jgi:hypothetical protein
MESIPDGARVIMIQVPERPAEAFWQKNNRVGVVRFALQPDRPLAQEWDFKSRHRAAQYFDTMKQSQEILYSPSSEVIINSSSGEMEPLGSPMSAEEFEMVRREFEET